MTTLFAQPYDVDACGFYFDSPDVYARKSSKLKNEFGQPVEEIEIQVRSTAMKAIVRWPR